MATDYAKKKNDELAALCKERGLAHTGKKADLVKRLEENDTKPSTSKALPEDEIDWDEEPASESAPKPAGEPAADPTAESAAELAKGASTESSANALAAGGVGEVDNPQTVPNQTAAVDPANTKDLSVAQPTENKAATTEAKKQEKDFTAGIANRTLEEEIEKRKARARKFGMPEDSDEIKALERAKRFGTTDLPGLLNSALPEGKDRKRGREGKKEGPRKRSRGPTSATTKQGEDKQKPVAGNASGKYPSWMSDKDREAAEKRKAKFAAT